MTDSLGADNTSLGVTSSTSRAADQARIRKQRREAKVKDNAGARLNKISGIVGGIARGLSLTICPLIIIYLDRGRTISVDAQ